MLFLAVFLVEVIAGYYVNHVKQLIMGDALSRVANAYYVFFIKPPHLASIGFVWNPLPSILELPFVLFAPIYKPIITSALAGVIVTAASSAGTAVLIYNNCRHFKLSSAVTWGITLFFCLNPFIFVYGFNGMSEAVFIFPIVLICTELVSYMEDEKQVRILIIGLAMALAFLARYEAVPLCIAVFCAFALIIFRKRKIKFHDLRSTYNYFEGTSVVLFLPVITAVGGWLLISWIIMKNPFYFLNSVYSNSAQSINIQNVDVIASIGHPLRAFFYELERTLPFLPVLIFILLLRIWNKTILKKETVILLMLATAIPALQYVMLVTGGSFGWLRFYFYVFPIAVVWLPYELSKTKFKKISSKQFVMAASVAMMVITTFITGLVMVNPKLAPEETEAYMIGNPDVAQQVEIAQYINVNIKQGKILMDAFRTYDIVLNINNTDSIITSCSYDFNDAVESPELFDVQYIVAVDNTGIGVLDAINIKYPNLYQNGAPWCTLVKQFNGFKLYKLNQTSS